MPAAPTARVQTSVEKPEQRLLQTALLARLPGAALPCGAVVASEGQEDPSR